LPLVGGDDQDLGALYPVAEEAVQPDGGGQSALSVAGGDGDQRGGAVT
jgi:hypothetical protein